MKRSGSRHYTEEELLMHFLQEETPNMAREISTHLQDCGECDSIFQEYGDLVGRIQSWTIPELPEEVWRSQKAFLLAQYRQDLTAGKGKGFLSSLQKALQATWTYALENPLPTLAYIAVAIAFAFERTISTFRLDRILPGASEVFEILKQVF
jgi:predicted anti-sigma-YlaC factor YlaD